MKNRERVYLFYLKVKYKCDYITIYIVIYILSKKNKVEHKPVYNLNFYQKPSPVSTNLRVKNNF